LLVLVLVLVLVRVLVVTALAAATDHAFVRCDHLDYTLVNLPLQGQTTVLVKKPEEA
jgi:hypothetical protein